MNLEILHKEDLPLGGFAGLKEHRIVTDKRLGWTSEGATDGLGNFVYLADAYFTPHGETRLHPHKEIDIISVMVDGNIHHEGSLENGQDLKKNQVQVQRAGAEGFKHNEINPDNIENRMLQIWVLPDNYGEPAGYKLFDLEQGKLTKVHGGTKEQNETFDSRTIVEVGLINKGQEITKDGEFLLYISRGSGIVNGSPVKDGDLVKGNNLNFTANENTQINLVSVVN